MGFREGAIVPLYKEVWAKTMRFAAILLCLGMILFRTLMASVAAIRAGIRNAWCRSDTSARPR